MLSIARESCAHLAGWTDVPTGGLETSATENSSPVDEQHAIPVCE